MAISAGVLHVNSGAASTTFTSAAFTPAGDALLIAFSSARTGGVVPVITDSLGGTWTTVPATNIDAGNLTGILAYQRATSSPASRTVTTTSTGSISIGLIVVAYTGSSTDTSNVGVNTNAAGDPAPVLPGGAGAATSTGLAFHSQNAGNAPSATPAAQGYSQVVNSLPTTNLRHSLFTDASSPPANPSWTSTGTDSIGIVWELKELPPSIADAWDANDKSAAITLSAGDKTATAGGSGQTAQSTQKYTNETAGKYYAEFKVNVTGGSTRYGIQRDSEGFGSASNSAGVNIANGAIQISGSGSTPTVGATPVANDIICMAWDAGAERIWFRLNSGLWNNDASADPATGTNGFDISAAIGAVSTALWFYSGAASSSVSVRTELADYTQTVPSGFLSWMGEASGPSPVTGTIAQTLTKAAQDASGTNTAPPTTGDIAQTTARASQDAAGTVTAAPAITGTAAQTTGRAAQDAAGTVTAGAGVSGTIAQTTGSAAQAAAGTYTPQAITGDVAQIGPAARQLLAGQFVGISAFQATAFQSENDAFQVEEPAPPGQVGFIANILGRASQAASGSVSAQVFVSGTIVQATGRAAQALSGTNTAPAAVTGTVAQTLSPAQQEAAGLVALPDEVTGDIEQTLSVAVQSATGTVTAPAITGTIIQATGAAQQAATGLVAAAGAIVGTIAQTAPSAQQAALGTVTGAAVPDSRPIGGFAGWSEAEEAAHRKYRRIKRRAEIELREIIEYAARGEEWPPAPVIEVVAELAEVAADSLLPLADLAPIKQQLALLEAELRRALEAAAYERAIAAAKLAEEEAVIMLLVA